ncbi:histone deacetylase 5 [Amborella trichopoda]|uniref:histone deacetylase 5 n=1 Tax=Amborella trichopoda TaxID=13333 RepID=UPI0005D46317|nr:histone deacetylase 5 [Amborella trichopoda]|eukprot:XP_011621109.1 histone deacetylase 5 [Amborella trichopoda]
MNLQRAIAAPPVVGLVYDERMCKHSEPTVMPHPESSMRIRAIWDKLGQARVTERCVIVPAKRAEDKDIACVHTMNHLKLIKSIDSLSAIPRSRIARRFNSIYLSEGSTEAAYLAAGSVLEVAERVAKGELNSGVAIVRPPGHHAEPDEAMGFCLFNNIAIAAHCLVHERPELGIHKILIVDWDVHHGNGTQKMFWSDSQVLFFSVHRFDSGTFYPSGDHGSHTMIGEGAGIGFNINVPWEHGRCGDADYLAVWDHILIPIARSYDPDMILISGGFDAAIGDPLGGCCITPYGYSIMTKKLMEFAKGKIVLALEGGYNLDSLENSVLACVETLLRQEKPTIKTPVSHPFRSTWSTIQMVRKILSPFWPVLSEELPQGLYANSRPYVFELSSSSDSDAEHKEEFTANSTEAPSGSVSDDFDILEPLGMLKIDVDGPKDRDALKSSLKREEIPCGPRPFPDQMVNVSVPWRPKYSEIDVWYACYGSNLDKSRFLCYVQGGQLDGMQIICRGAKDKSPPKEISWRMVPHRLFFAYAETKTWGPGGSAFLRPKRNDCEKTHVCMYKITLEQFNDILLQENDNRGSDLTVPLVDLSALSFVESNESTPLEVMKETRYGNLVCLGNVDGCPILTITCSLSDVEDFKSGKKPRQKPCKRYIDTLVVGLTNGLGISEDEALAYIDYVASRPL